jgi:indolepyruvate ferredoxin oxidoreductase, alpha subunit
VATQKNFELESEKSAFNAYYPGTNKKLGIICCGLAINYLNENYTDEKCPYPILKITQYPLPVAKIQQLAVECDELLVVEEGYPIVEEMLRGVLSGGKTIKGRLDGSLPREGELNPDLLAAALGIKCG